MHDGIPVTVLCGPLGAGKTTTVNHLLENNDGRSIAVLVNDMGSVNVDADLLSAGTNLAADGGVAELSNGCICCERQDDLETEVARLASEREFESLVVEASGISEPAPAPVSPGSYSPVPRILPASMRPWVVQYTVARGTSSSISSSARAASASSIRSILLSNTTSAYSICSTIRSDSGRSVSPGAVSRLTRSSSPNAARNRSASTTVTIASRS